MWVGCSTTKGGTHLSELFGFLPVRVLVQLVSARGQLGALRHDLGFLSHVPSQFCRFSIKTFLLAGASFRCARGRYVRGWCIHGPYGSSRPCRVARLDGVKRRACDDCLVHAAVSHEELPPSSFSLETRKQTSRFPCRWGHLYGEIRLETTVRRIFK